jgi:hypothetical protein
MGLNLRDEISENSFFRYNNFLFPIYLLGKEISLFITNKRFSDEQYIKRLFKKYQGYELDLENPKTLNEKLQWLKLHDRRDFQTIHADKYAARDYIKNAFGENYLIPLMFHTTDYRELIPENLPNFPFVIKTNHGFGNTVIVRDKTKADWEKVRMDYRRYMHNNYYFFEREWQYKNIKPRIIVEKLLLNSEGKLPNDYKLNFIEGNLEFVYVSVDREGTNKRNIYDSEWNPLFFTWARKGKDVSNLRGKEIKPPQTLSKMIEFGTIIAKSQKYLRVDFYDVDGVLYFGEITQCHGGGFDKMLPYEIDLKYGEMINLGTI